MDTTNKLAEEQERFDGAIEFALQALDDIANKRRQSADVIEPIRTINDAAKLASVAHSRLHQAQVRLEYEIEQKERAAKSDAAQATQAVSEPVATQPAEAVAEFTNGSWRLRIGSVWMTAPNPPVGPEMVNEEYRVRMYAARINAEIKGGVAAFGCDVEARGLTYSDGDKISRCGSWCGLDRCAVTLKGDLE